MPKGPSHSHTAPRPMHPTPARAIIPMQSSQLEQPTPMHPGHVMSCMEQKEPHWDHSGVEGAQCYWCGQGARGACGTSSCVSTNGCRCQTKLSPVMLLIRQCHVINTPRAVCFVLKLAQASLGLQIEGSECFDVQNRSSSFGQCAPPRPPPSLTGPPQAPCPSIQLVVLFMMPLVDA